MKVLIDNGHGAETPGKRSPDGRLREYAYAREIVIRVASKLQQAGIDAVRIVPEETDVPLAERVNRANRAYTEAGKQAILVSIHCNAMGSGAEWMPARGWSVFVGGNASQKSKLLARTLAEAALSKKSQGSPTLPATALLDCRPLHLSQNQLPCRVGRKLLPGQPGGCGLPAVRSREAVRDGHHGGRNRKLSESDMIKPNPREFQVSEFVI